MLCKTPRKLAIGFEPCWPNCMYGTTDWHDASRRAIPHVMLSDCRSLVANLNTEVPSRVQDKRLQIELDAIRQSIFDGDGRRTAEVYPKGGDRVDWVATATQLADCLTRTMKPTYMLRVLDASAPIGQEELKSARTKQAAAG